MREKTRYDSVLQTVGARGAERPANALQIELERLRWEGGRESSRTRACSRCGSWTAREGESRGDCRSSPAVTRPMRARRRTYRSPICSDDRYHRCRNRGMRPSARGQACPRPRRVPSPQQTRALGRGSGPALRQPQARPPHLPLERGRRLRSAPDTAGLTERSRGGRSIEARGKPIRIAEDGQMRRPRVAQCASKDAASFMF